jgi:hypothetical protein
VGKFPANPWGLYDMHGNVWEWCQDELEDDKGSPKIYKSRDTLEWFPDELKDDNGAWQRVARGGGWNFGAGLCRAALSRTDVPSRRDYNLGLRVARVRAATSVPDRRAAEWVLKDRGPQHPSYLTLFAADKFVYLTTGDRVPEGPFEVWQISISGLGKADSAVAIDNLTKLPSSDLRIYHSPGIGDDELAALASHPGYQDLKVLVMNTVGVTERGLPHIAKFTKLETLVLGLAPVSGKELAQLRGLRLNNLTIFISKSVNDDAIAEVAAFPGLKRLSLAELPITDQSLEHLAKCKTLESLTFARMSFSEAARKKLAAALPSCKIKWDGEVIDPTGSTAPDARASD